MTDRLRAKQQQELLKSRYIGVGTSDTTKYEWATDIKRDTYASLAAHSGLLELTAISLAESPQLTRQKLVEKMIRPLGPPKSDKTAL